MEKQTWHILLVSTSRTDFEHLRALLEESSGAGVDAHWTRGYAEGRQALAGGNFDAVLAGRDLGIEDALALVRGAAGCEACPPVILLASETTEPARLADLDQAALEAGAAGLLVWDELTAARLWRAVRYAARQRERRQPAAARRRPAAQTLAAASIERQHLSIQRQQSMLRRDSLPFQSAFEELPVGIAVLSGPELVYRYINRAIFRFLPHPERDPIGRPQAEVWPLEEGFGPIDKALQQVQATGQPDTGEGFPLHMPGGSTRHFAHHFRFILWQGQPAVLALVWEVTELVETRAAAQRQASELETIFNALTEAVVVYNAAGRLMRANPAMREMMGFDPTGKTLADITARLAISKPDGTPFKPAEMAVSRALAGESVRDLALVVRRARHDQTLHIQTGARPLLGEDGQVSGAVVTWHNITEQKLAEQELRQLNRSLRASEQKYRTLVESLQEGLWRVDETGQTVFVNERMADMLGYTVDEMIGQPLSSFVPQEELPLLATEFAQYQAGVPGQFEHRLLHKSGALLEVLAAANPIFDEQGEYRGAIAGIIDMTDRRLILRALEEREAQARRYAEELERSNRELEQFAFIASHDLQEPLRKVKGFSELLADRYQASLDDTGRDYLARMNSAVTRMQRMITDLLAFSRVSTRGRPFEPVDLNTVAADVVSDLEIGIQHSQAAIELDELPAIMADPTQMYQLLQNLLGNALKYRRKDTPPRVRVTASPGEPIAGREAVEIVVADNGIGFPPNQAERIFQPFQRLHGRSEYEGSGIGLSICRKIVERHGGSIRAESEPGQGSRFIVHLPVEGKR